MAKTYKFYLLGLLLTSNISIVKSQDQVSQIIAAGTSDANILSKAYLKPFFNGMGVAFSQGWASRGDVKTGLLDIKILGAIALVPTEDLGFDASKLGLSSTIQVNGEGSSPTFSGANNPGATLDIYGNNPITGKPQKLTSLNSPNGSGISFIPVAIPQVSVGLPLHTEISLRLFPDLKIKEVKIGVYGLALKHELSKYIHLIPVHLSLLAGYTQTNIQYPIHVNPDESVNNNTGGDYSTQVINLKSGSLTIGVIASKKISVLTFHLGAHYYRSSGLLTTTGTYPITVYDNSGNRTIRNVIDPIHVAPDIFSGISTDGGFQLKLGPFILVAEGSLGKYNSANGGIGFSF